MSDTLEELIQMLKRPSPPPGIEIAFLRHGNCAFDRLSAELASVQTMPRMAMNILDILFALLEACPDRARDLLKVCLAVAEDSRSLSLRGRAASVAIRVAMVAEHPAVHIPCGELERCRRVLKTVLGLGLRPQDSEYVHAYLAKLDVDPGARE